MLDAKELGKMSKASNVEKIAFKTRVADSKKGMMLLDYLCERFNYHSRDKWKENIKNGEIEINGRLADAKVTLFPGDQIAYVTTKRAEPKVPKNIPILFEDKDLLIVNKPAHIPVHPGGKYLQNTLISLLRSQAKKSDLLILAHRLDRETSGVCVINKTPLAKEKMYWKFFNREVDKKYWALTWGTPNPRKGKIDIPIGAATLKGKPDLSQIRIKQMARGYKSKKATTKYKVLSTSWFEQSHWSPPEWPDILKVQNAGEHRWPISLVECEPQTGRTNQIRVHLAEIGCGIVGDKLYDPKEDIFLGMTQQKPVLEGDSEPAGPRLDKEFRARMVLDAQALHARSLRFRHPRTSRWLEVEAPAPKSWKGLYKSP